MSKFLGILVLLALGYGIYALIGHYKNYEDNPANGAVTAPANPGEPAAPPVEDVPTESLAGLSDKLQPSLKAAYAQGAAGLGAWLKNYRRYAADPRLAGIELDYCVLLARTNPSEAKAVFASVKKRVRPDSPLFGRVKRLSPSFE